MPVNGPIPGAWFTLPQVVEIRMSYMNISGQFPAPDWPASSSVMAQLIHLCLKDFPQVYGNLAGMLEWLAGRPQMTNIYLGNWGSVTNNSAQHPVLEALPMSFPVVHHVEVSNLGLSGTLPASWWRLFDAPTTGVYLYNNKLRGRIPAAWTTDAGAPTSTPASLVDVYLQ
jgi:hypothetical protein